ncbi:MAG: response regulator transcription factor [Candidatus Pristimantibacillus sp.]
MVRILVVDDDNYIRELVGHFLKAEGYELLEASNGEEALALLGTVSVELVILDIMMPEMDGWELCRHIRDYDAELPCLMLTAKGETSQKLKGFELGADDYLVKPFEPLELIARVKSLLRRYRIAVSHKTQIGNLTLDQSTHLIEVNGKSSAVPLKEFELLFKLASYPGQSFSRGQLIESIWGYDFEGNERTLDVHINRLRERFPEESHLFRIVTIRGLGYRLETL